MSVAPWLTLPQFSAVSGWSRPTVYRRQRDGAIDVRKDGRATLYSSASLPAEVLHKLATPSQPRKQTPRPAELVKAHAPLFAKTDSAPGRRIVLQPEQERQALERLKILQPLLDYCDDAEARARFAILRLRDGSHIRNSEDMALYLSQTHDVSRSTLWRWKSEYEKRGLEALVRKVRQDKGQSKWAQRWPEAAQLALATYLRPFQTKQTAYDALVRDRAVFDMSEEELPSYASVCDFLATIPAAAAAWAREGEAAHHTRMMPYLQRKYTDVAPNQVWVADTMIHDAIVRNDCFGACGNEAVRLQLTAIMDLRSRKLVGYTWVLDGSSRSITTALIMAVRRYGPCEVFYCDNGKDFQKVGRFARPANCNAQVDEDMQAVERTGALRQLGIDVQYCIKYHPQSKPIERFFRTLHLKLDAQFPHYTTGNAYLKPDVTVAAAAAHKKVLQMDRADLSPLVPASLFIAMGQRWIEEDYNARHQHGGRGMDGRTPDQVFAPALEARREFDLEILDTLLWRRERRLVRNCAVTIDKRRLIGDSPFAANAMYVANESEVIVAFDPNAPEYGVVTDLDGHRLCAVRAELLAPHSAEAAPLIEASLQQGRGLRNDMAASVRQLRKDVTRAGHQTQIQILAERAQLPAAVGDHITQPVARASVNAAVETKQVHSEDIGDELAARLARRALGA
jgi:transposase InsO family protein